MGNNTNRSGYKGRPKATYSAASIYAVNPATGHYCIWSKRPYTKQHYETRDNGVTYSREMDDLIKYHAENKLYPPIVRPEFVKVKHRDCNGIPSGEEIYTQQRVVPSLTACVAGCIDGTADTEITREVIGAITDIPGRA